MGVDDVKPEGSGAAAAGMSSSRVAIVADGPQALEDVGFIHGMVPIARMKMPEIQSGGTYATQ